MINEENYFDHDADMGIIGRGNSIEESFENAAEAMFGLMAKLSTVQAKTTTEFEFEENDLELALVTWLNLLIAKAQTDNLIFASFKIKKEGSLWHCAASGAPWTKNIEHGVEVKGATLTMLSVKEKSGKWEARCVVDV